MLKQTVIVLNRPDQNFAKEYGYHWKGLLTARLSCLHYLKHETISLCISCCCNTPCSRSRMFFEIGVGFYGFFFKYKTFQESNKNLSWSNSVKFVVNLGPVGTFFQPLSLLVPVAHLPRLRPTLDL